MIPSLIAFAFGFLAMCLIILVIAYVSRIGRYNALARRLSECESYTRTLEGQLYKIRTMCAAEPQQRTTEAVRAAIIKARAESGRRMLS